MRGPISIFGVAAGRPRFAECFVESFDDEARLILRQHQRRTDLEHIVSHRTGAEQHALVSHPVDNVARELAIRRPRGAIADKLDPDEKAGTAHVADGLVPDGETGDALAQELPDLGSVLHQPLSLDGVQHCQCRRARHGVAGKGVEVARVLPELRQGVGGRHQSRDRLAVAHRLSHRDDVGHDTMALEAPQVFAGAAEAGLDLVGDEQAARPLDRVDRAPQEARRFREDAVAGEQ